jgi:hypothetical protein
MAATTDNERTRSDSATYLRIREKFEARYAGLRFVSLHQETKGLCVTFSYLQTERHLLEMIVRSSLLPSIKLQLP